MIHLIALQIATDPSLSTVGHRWRLANRLQKLSLAVVDQTVSGKIHLREVLAALLNDLKLSKKQRCGMLQTRPRAFKYP
jgi:hypothetical protein